MYVTASPSHHDQAIPILSPLLFMHVGHPYISLFKIQRIFDLLVLFTTMFTVIIVVCSLKSMHMPSVIFIGCCVSELHGHLRPCCNVLPEAVYCCFTKTIILFAKLFMI